MRIEERILLSRAFRALSVHWFDVLKRTETADRVPERTQRLAEAMHEACHQAAQLVLRDYTHRRKETPTTKDIAAIPTATDGKFRLHRCRVVGEKDIESLVQAVRTGEA